MRAKQVLGSLPSVTTAKTLRKDYQVLALISLWYLGGSLSSPIPINATWAHHHARLMAKIIYTIKIVLFRDQLKEFFKPQMLDSIQNLATFRSLFYVKSWLCSTKATGAPRLDLDLMKLLEKTKTKVRDPETIKMVEAAYVKLKDHLWYLSERLVPPALFSARVADRDEKEMANAILKY